MKHWQAIPLKSRITMLILILISGALKIQENITRKGEEIVVMRMENN